MNPFGSPGKRKRRPFARGRKRERKRRSKPKAKPRARPKRKPKRNPRVGPRAEKGGTGFWPTRFVYVISIRRAREAACRMRLNAIEPLVRRWRGVDGRKLGPPPPKMTRGKMGCYASHKRIWRDVSRLPAGSVAMVLEDDADLRATRRTAQRIQRALDQLHARHKGWDVLYLARNRRRRKNLRPAGPGLVVPGESWGMFAYMIRPKGAIKLLNHPKSKAMTQPCDVVMSTMGIHGRLNLFAMTPCLCKCVGYRSDTANIK